MSMNNNNNMGGGGGIGGINNTNQNLNKQVSFISSTYDPSRQKSAMQQSIKNTSQLPPPPQSYPQPSTINTNNSNSNGNTNNTKASTNSNSMFKHNIPYNSMMTKNGGPSSISGNTEYREKTPYMPPMNTSSKNISGDTKSGGGGRDSGGNAHPFANHTSHSGRGPSGLPIHPNSREGQNIRLTATSSSAASQQSQNTANNDKIIEKVSDKIYNHFKGKYPTTIEASGFNKTTITTVVSQAMKKEPMNEKTIGKIIDIIDHKFKTAINSDNRQGVQFDTTSFSMDTESKISIDKYLENYTNKVSNLLDTSDKAIEAELPKQMAPANDQVKIEPPEPFSEDFPIRDRSKQTDMMIPEVREYDYNIIVNSNDRNIIKSPDPNTFIIEFGPAPSGETVQTGYVDRTFSNIKSCELLNVVILDTSDEADASDHNTTFPYLLLQFDELQNNYFGTNPHISKSFAILTNFSTLTSGTGKTYKYYRLLGDSAENTIIKVYNPRINLSRLTTRLLLPDGTPFKFGAAFKDNITNSCITFGFRITTIQKNLSTSFVNSA